MTELRETMTTYSVIGLQEAEERLVPKNPRLARLVAGVGPRSYQEYVIDYWNQNEAVPDDLGSVLLSSPAVHTGWRRRAA
jgi:hypothetical protein